MLLSYGTIFQSKCARLPPPLTLTLCLLLSCRVLLFLHLSFTLVLKPTSSIIHIPLSLLYLQDGYSGFRPASPLHSSHCHSHSVNHSHSSSFTPPFVFTAELIQCLRVISHLAWHDFYRHFKSPYSLL